MASLNAGPEYYAAEERYRNAKTVEEKLAALQEMLKFAPKHKSSESLLLEIKSKIAKLRKETEKEERKKKASKGGKGEFVRKQGAAQVVIIGFPNTGKSTLFNALTGLRVPATSTPFETRTLVPGMWLYEKVQVQVIDTPSLVENNKPRIFAFARPADVVIKMVNSGEEKKFFEHNAGVFLHGKEVLQVSFADLKNPEQLKRRIFEKLGLIRIYTKPPRGEADMSNPIAMRCGARVADVAKEISKEISKNVMFARVWGSSKFPGQQVKSDYVLQDEDVVEIHTR